MQTEDATVILLSYDDRQTQEKSPSNFEGVPEGRGSLYLPFPSFSGS